MIELPNGKISRTLAEQVGFNSAKIAEIIKFLNESGLKDLVINLESDSGTLSTDQYAIAELSPSYMVYDGAVFYKVFEDSDYIDYFLLQEKVDTINSDLAVSKWRIRVERDSRNYALEEVSLFTSYDKSQIDSIISALNSAKADLTGANFTGAITAPSIIENMEGYSFTKSTLTTPIELQYAYAGVVKNGNKITIAIAGTLIRRGTVTEAFVLGRFNIPSAVGSKLFPFASSTISYKQQYLARSSIDGITTNVRILKYSDSLIEVSMASLNISSMTIDTNYYFRYEETFLLGDNLAE